MLFQTALGIYISERTVAVAYLKTSFKEVRLVDHGLYPLDKDKPLKDRMRPASAFVREFMARNRVAASHIYIGIPRDMTIVKEVDFPLAVKENLRSTLRYEMEKLVPLPLEDISFDYQIIEEDKIANTIRVLLIVVKQSLIDTCMELKNRIERGISGIEISSTALVSVLFALGDIRTRIDALIYCENGTVELNLLKGGQLVHTRSVHVDDDAEALNHILGKEFLPMLVDAGQEGMKAAFLGKGGDQNKVFIQLREREDIQLHPLDTSSLGLPSYAMAPAFGVALRGLQKVPMDVNVLPFGLRKRPSRVGYYTLFALLGLLLIAILMWGGSEIMRQRMMNEAIEAQTRRVVEEINHIDQIKAQAAAVENKINYINDLWHERIPALDVVKELSILIPETAYIQDLRVNEKKCSINGFASESASELIQILEGSPLFEEVNFLSPITRGRDNKERFRIGFKIEKQ